MKMIAAILVVAFLALPGATNAMTVYEKLRQKKLNKFIGLIDMLDLDYGFQTLLDDPKFTGTVFALTDKAADAMEASVQDMGGLADLLNYHIIPAKRLKTKDMPKGVKAWDSQLIGHQVLTEIKGKARRIIDEKKNKVKIYKRNLRADKAVIHVLTQDLKPKIWTSSIRVRQEPICLLYIFSIKICNQASLMAGVCAQDSDKNEEVRRSIAKSRTISDLDVRKSQNSFINLFRTNLFIS